MKSGEGGWGLQRRYFLIPDSPVRTIRKFNKSIIPRFDDSTDLGGSTIQRHCIIRRDGISQHGRPNAVSVDVEGKNQIRCRGNPTEGFQQEPSEAAGLAPWLDRPVEQSQPEMLRMGEALYCIVLCVCRPHPVAGALLP